MPESQEPLLTDPRSYESDDGDVLPLELMVDPVTSPPSTFRRELASIAVASTPDKEVLKDENIDTETALYLLHKDVGFYAHGNEEKNSMLGIASHFKSGFPTLHYLDVIEYHQRNSNIDNPIRTLVAITEKFLSYATEAHAEAGLGRLFIQDINRRPLDTRQKLSHIISTEDLMNEDTTRRTLTAIARFKEVELFIDKKADNPLGVNDGIDSLTGREKIERIFELLDTMRMGGVMQLSARVIDAEDSRFEYWRDRLVESRMRSSIRDTVDKKIARLNTLRPRK
jgi:hypothetical protein